MQRRHFIAAAGAGIAGSLARVGVADDSKSGHKDDDDHKSVMRECADECYDCAEECDACYAHCADLVAKGNAKHVETMKSCLDCAAICRTAGESSARNGIYATNVCKTCAEICDLCAAACEKHPQDEHMKACAEACRECAKACREMTSHDSEA